jgi:hypothetical protein
MGYIKDKDVVEKLIELLREIVLNTKDRDLFHEVRDALIRIGMVAISPLEFSMDKEDNIQFTTTIKDILRNINPPNYDANASFMPYSNQMEDDIQKVMESSIPSSMGMPSAMEILQKPLRGIYTRLNHTRKKSRDDLADAILPVSDIGSSKSDDYVERIMFITSDPEMRRRVTNHLLKTLNAFDPNERIKAIDYLADYGDRRALPELARIMRGELGDNETIRQKAKYAHDRISRR